MPGCPRFGKKLSGPLKTTKAVSPLFMEGHRGIRSASAGCRADRPGAPRERPKAHMTMTTKFQFLTGTCLGAALVLVPSAARAEGHTLPTLRDASSVRSAGMGNATRGFASSDEALWVNPAGMSAAPRFNINASASFEVPKDRGLQLYTVGAIDSKLNADTSFPLAGGVSYTYYRSGYGEEKRTGSIVLLGLSLALWYENLTLGVTGKYLKLDGAVDTNAVTMDVGLVLRPIDILSIGAVGYNLIGVNSEEARRAWGFGIALGSDKSFRLAFDAKLEKDQEDKWAVSYYGGGEYLIAGMFMPRVGYTWDALRDTHKVGGGLSVFVSGFAVEAAYQYLFEGSHFFGLSLRVLNPGGN